MAGAPTATMSTIDERLATHLLRRLWRASQKSILEFAIGIELIACAYKESDGREIGVLDRGFAGAEASSSAIRQLLRRSRIQKSSAHLMGLTNDGEITIDALYIDELSQHAGNAEPVVDDKDGLGTWNEFLQRAASKPLASLLSLIRNCAEPPPASQVATILLLAQGMTKSSVSLPDALAALSIDRAIVSICCEVPGFERALMELLEQGHVLPRQVSFTNGYELHQRFSSFQFSGSKSSSQKVLWFGGKDFDRDHIDWAIGQAAQAPYPILCVAEASHELPERLAIAANLQLHCGGLTNEIVNRTIQIVLGDVPDESLEPQHLSRLELADLALAVRPGVSPLHAITVLRAIAANRDQTVSGQYATDNDTGHKGSNGKARRPRTKDKEQSGLDPSSDLIEPKPLSGDDGEDKFILRLEKLSGFGQANDWAMALKDDLELWRAGDLAWEEMTSRILLSGPPGTGKTSFARALCNTLGIPLIATSVVRWMEGGYLSDVLTRMHDTFAMAERHRPAIMLIDEFDGIGNRGRTSRDYNDYWTSVINKLLELLDGAVKSQGVIIVGATNNPAVIDQALLRPGRLETHIEILKPDAAALAGIFRHHLKNDIAALVESAPQELTNANNPDPGSAKAM